MIKEFLSCDWGTSSFRLKLANTSGHRVIADETSDNGILRSFELWKQLNQPEENRLRFYARMIDHHIKKLEQKLNRSLNNVPVIMSGMASSNIGMMGLAYKPLPFRLDGSDLHIKTISADKNFMHDITIISGACTNSDIMRGEETQLVGCDHPEEKTIYIFPGTHSKHITAENEMAIDSKTFMTGEFFELLSQKSILAASIEKGEGISKKENKKSFQRGVEEGLRSNILQSSFQVRVNSIFNKLSAEENYHYLSGLVIGTELKDLTGHNNIVIICKPEQASYYKAAFETQAHKISDVKFQDIEQATIKGQLIIAQIK